MSDEIQEFLQRAAARRHQQKQQQPIEVEVIDEVEIVDETIANHVAKRLGEHLDKSSLVSSGAQLGAEVGLADEKLESHLHDAFDHRLGSLGARLEGSKDATDLPESTKAPTMASEIAALFRSTKFIRQAVIMSEVLQRPEHRW